MGFARFFYFSQKSPKNSPGKSYVQVTKRPVKVDFKAFSRSPSDKNKTFHTSYKKPVGSMPAGFFVFSSLVIYRRKNSDLGA
jgi:hypothetical protein